MAEVTVDGDPGTMTVSTANLQPGEYMWWVGVWYGDEVMHGGKTTGMVTVLETEPAVPSDSVITLTLPASLKKVEEEAFSGLTAQKVIINAAGSVYIDPRAFANSSVIVVEIPENVTFVPQGGIVVMTR
jgi:hypothetical protein